MHREARRTDEGTVSLRINPFAGELAREGRLPLAGQCTGVAAANHAGLVRGLFHGHTHCLIVYETLWRMANMLKKMDLDSTRRE
jgi:hypothetical protein